MFDFKNFVVLLRCMIYYENQVLVDHLNHLSMFSVVLHAFLFGVMLACQHCQSDSVEFSR